jgi:hypothetical protein
MASAGVSNSALADRVRQVARQNGTALHCTHVDVRRWLDGVVPRPATAQYIATALSQRAGRRVSVEEIGMAGAAQIGAVLDAGLSYPADGLAAAGLIYDLTQHELADDTQTLVVPVIPAAWSETALTWLLSRPGRFREQVGNARVSLGDVAAIRATSDMFVKLDFQYGGGHARSALAQYFAHDVRPLLKGDYTESVGRALFSVAAEIAQLLGWTAYDIGRHGLAQRYQIQALRLAQEAGDVLMCGRMLADMSHQANYLGNSSQAVQLARAAQEGAGSQATATTRAMFYAMEARGHASAGDELACSQALAQAERQFAQRDTESDPEWMAYFTVEELAGEAAHCFRDLRRPDLTQEFVTQAELCGPEYARTLAFIRLVHAAAWLHAGEPIRATELATEAVSLADGLKSARYRRYVRDLWRDLTPYATVPDIRAFGELVTRLD